MLTMLAYNVMMMPKKVLQGQDINQPISFIQNPIGTGPYKWKEFVSGDHVTLVANPDYWDGPPKIGTVVYKILPDLNTQVAQLRAGQVDVVMLEPSQVDALQNVPNVVINAANQTNYQYLSVSNSNPLFADKNVRQALSYALDRRHDGQIRPARQGLDGERADLAADELGLPAGSASPSPTTRKRRRTCSLKQAGKCRAAS